MAVACVMGAYFALNFAIFPQTYQDVPVAAPQPSIDVTLSTPQIRLGESFDLSITATNNGEEADLQTITVEFPQNQNLDNIQIKSYDFLQSPKLFLPEQQIGTNYTGGQTMIQSKYPFIEAYNRPAKPGLTHSMTLQITPTVTGIFTIYSKTVAMPHINDLSHFPIGGTVDHQNEFVLEHIVMVVP